MSLSGSVQKAKPGLIGFDHSAGRLNRAQAKQYFSKGYRFCVRYISRTPESRETNATSGRPDLSQDEAQDLLDAGLALMAVQHVAGKGWKITSGLGKSYGENAASYASSAGLLEGVNVWLDLEDVLKGTPTPDIIAYANDWFDAVAIAGYEPGVYLGFDTFLSPDDLFFKLKFKHYWRAPGNVPDVAHRGYQLIQHIEKTASGEFDRDVTQNDAYGEGVLWQTQNPELIA